MSGESEDFSYVEETDAKRSDGQLTAKDTHGRVTITNFISDKEQKDFK